MEVTDEKIHEVVKQFHPLKTPRPGGMQAVFKKAEILLVSLCAVWLNPSLIWPYVKGN